VIIIGDVGINDVLALGEALIVRDGAMAMELLLGGLKNGWLFQEGGICP